MSMMTTEELAHLVSHKVNLRKIGHDKHSGLCPFHNEKTPSFSVFTGKRGEGRFHCYGCGADGDGADWLMKIEGRTRKDALGDCKIDPRVEQDRLVLKRREAILTVYRDRNPESPVPDWAIDTTTRYQRQTPIQREVIKQERKLEPPKLGGLTR